MSDAGLPGTFPAVVQGAGSSLAIDGGANSWESSRWFDQLQPGSWRGVGFVMDAAETHAGRRIALHEYPYRDTVWPEDLGKLPRRFAFQAFIVGDDCYQQRDAMVAACEQSGPGTLVHPTMGSIQCVLLDFTTTDRRERGRMVELAFQFVIYSDLMLPTTSSSTGDEVLQRADDLNTAASQDLNAILVAMQRFPQAAAGVAGDFANLAIGTVDDAARAVSAVKGLAGYFGRYAAGSRQTLQPTGSTVASALASSITTRTSVLNAASVLVSAAGAL